MNGEAQSAQKVSIDGKEYDLENFTPEQRMLLDHCADLDRKLVSCQFQFDQLRVGKDAFLTLLKKSLEAGEATEVAEVADEVVQ